MKQKLFASILFLLFIALLPMAIKASEVSRGVLVVWTNDGVQTAYALSKRPVLRFTDTEMLITGEGIEATYPLDQFKRYTYESSDFTGIRDLNNEKGYGTVSGDYLLFPSLTAHSTVSIYALSGRLILQKAIKVDGEYAFPLASLPVGVYVVKVNGLTYKIAKQ
jgi:hypothetical protein